MILRHSGRYFSGVFGLALTVLTLVSCAPALAQGSTRDVENSVRRFRGITGWTGTFSYKLDMDQNESFGDFSFLASSGELASQDEERIDLEGEVTFSGGSGGKFVATGTASYRLESFSLVTWGDKKILDTADGSGNSGIIAEEDINFLQFELREGSYSLSISPGEYCEDRDEFGVGVNVSGRLELTDSFLEDLENADREVPFPHLLRAMFPENINNPGCLDIGFTIAAFPLPAFGNILSGSLTDHKGGVLSWELQPVDAPRQEFLVPVEITEPSYSSIHFHPPDDEELPRIRALTIEAEMAERSDDSASPGSVSGGREVMLFLAEERESTDCGGVEGVTYTLGSAGGSSKDRAPGNDLLSRAVAHVLELEGGSLPQVEDEALLAQALVSLQSYDPKEKGPSGLTNELYGRYLVGGIDLDRGTAIIQLLERLDSLQSCQAERIRKQLEATAKQFSYVTAVRLVFNPGSSPEEQP